MTRTLISGLLLVGALAATACSSGSSGDPTGDDASSTGTDERAGSAFDPSGSELARVTESSDDILFDLPEGWESDTVDIDDARGYRLFRTDNDAIEQEIIAEHALEGLTAPFFALERERSNALLGPLGGGVRMDPRIQELAYITMVLTEAPILDDAPWGPGWDELDDVMAYASWNYGGIEDDEATEIMEIAGGPAVAFVSRMEGVPNHRFIHVLLTPDKQLLRIEVYPTDSVHADEIDSILESLRKGEPGWRFSY